MKMEEVDIYDGNMNPTGITKIRHKDEIEKGEYIIGVQGIIINSKKEILISQRSAKKELSPLMWECNGGAIKKGENGVSGVLREMKEELGLQFEEKEAIHIKTVKKEKQFKILYLFYKDINVDDIKFEDGEAIDAKWVNIDEFMQMFENNEIVQNVDFNRKDFEECLKLIEQKKEENTIDREDEGR